LQFGPYEADLATGELKKDGARVALQDKPFQILALLLRRPGELVTREELRAALWPADTFVDFEHGLNTAVKKLRQALDDSADTPRYVETLPRRGYRFIAEVQGAPVEAAAVIPPSTPPARTAWHPHAAGILVVLLAVALVLNRGDRSTGLPPNPRPVVVLMDSPLPGRVYDPRTLAAGGTNADDLTDALQSLPVAVQKENTSAMWHREDQLVRQNPDLVVSHLSCLFDERFGEPERRGPVNEHLFAIATSRLVGVFGFVAAANPRTRFLVYSRGAFTPPERAAAFVAEAETRFPGLRGRIETFAVPGDLDHATFRDPETARLIRERIRGILEPPR
jgi:DNA-binding winged helix-turn-helix (wHTH) protein